MIHAHDAALHGAPALNDATAAAPPRRTPRAIVRVLYGVLFLTIFTSFFAMVEPSPHDVMMGPLGLVCVIAGVGLQRQILPLLLLLVAWNVSGLFALFELEMKRDVLQYTAVSFYLGIAAILVACIVAQDSVRRMNVIKFAYIAGALISAVIGIAAYFKLVPSSDLFLLYDRARSTFKDPNVFGPFLILPLLFLIQSILVRGPRLFTTGATLLLLIALVLSFSRGAWFHLVLSATIMIVLMVLTASSQRARTRIIAFTGLAVGAVGGMLAALFSVGSLRAMLMQRAQLVQSYDVGEGGRFRLQELALQSLFNSPLGFGPLEFGRMFGLQQHNSYLQAFIVYGWIGGVAYAVMVVLTLIVGLRACLIRTPWQPCLIAAYGAFIGEAAESFIIDTDHWRHYFLILGIVWGLSAATMKETKRRRFQPQIA